MKTRAEIVADELEALRLKIADHNTRTESTDEQNAEFRADLDAFDALRVEHDDLVDVAERAQRAADFRARVATVQIAPAETNERLFDNLDALAFDRDAKHAPKMNREVTSRAAKALESHRLEFTTDDQLQRAVMLVESIPGAAQHALIHGSPAYRSAFEEWVRSQGQPIYTPEQADAVRASLALGNSTGGYVLPTLLDPTIIHTGTASRNDLRSISRVVSGTQNVWHGASAGNVTSYWTAEAAGMTEGSPTLAGPSVTAAKLTAYLKGSYEIFEDSNLQAQLPGLIDESFSYTEQDAFVSGSGSGAPKGVLVAISGTAGDTVTCSTRGTYAYGDLNGLHDAAATRYENSSTFLANKTIYTATRMFSTSSIGGLFWGDQRGDQPRELIDSPYVKASAMTTSTASGSIFMIYGDFSQFLIYDRIGTSVEFVQNVFNTSGVPTGERALVAHKRVGSDVTDLNAFRFLKG